MPADPEGLTGSHGTNNPAERPNPSDMAVDPDENARATLRLAKAIEAQTQQRERENQTRATIARGLYPVGSIPPGVPLPKWGRRDREDRQHARACPDERGYVKAPMDEAAYVAAKDILKSHMPPQVGRTHKHLVAILKRHPEIKRWQPRINRLSVHLADWYAYLERRRGEPAAADSDAGWPSFGDADVAERAAQIRVVKSIG